MRINRLVFTPCGSGHPHMGAAASRHPPELPSDVEPLITKHLSKPEDFASFSLVLKTRGKRRDQPSLKFIQWQPLKLELHFNDHSDEISFLRHPGLLARLEEVVLWLDFESPRLLPALLERMHDAPMLWGLAIAIGAHWAGRPAPSLALMPPGLERLQLDLTSVRHQLPFERAHFGQLVFTGHTLSIWERPSDRLSTVRFEGDSCNPRHLFIPRCKVAPSSLRQMSRLHVLHAHTFTPYDFGGFPDQLPENLADITLTINTLHAFELLINRRATRRLSVDELFKQENHHATAALEVTNHELTYLEIGKVLPILEIGCADVRLELRNVSPHTIMKLPSEGMSAALCNAQP